MRIRIAIMVALALVVGSVLVGTAPQARACSCAGPVPAQHAIGAADFAFVATAISTREHERDPDSFDFFADDEWTVRVEQTYKGVLPPTVEFLTHNDPSGRGGGDCGGASFRPGDRIAVLANIDGDGTLRAHFGMCAPSVTESEMADRGELAPPTATGPVRSIVGIRDHDATLAVLNDQHEVLAYGFGSDSPYAISLCADGRHFVSVEMRSRPNQILMLWDASTMASREILDLGSEHRGMPHSVAQGVGCKDPDHIVVITPEIAPDYEGDVGVRARGYRVSAGRTAEIGAPARVHAVIPRTTEALVVGDGTIERWDLFANGSRPTASIPFAASSPIKYLIPNALGTHAVVITADSNARTVELESGNSEIAIAAPTGDQAGARWEDARWEDARWLDDFRLSVVTDRDSVETTFKIIDVRDGTIASPYVEDFIMGSVGGGSVGNIVLKDDDKAVILSLDGTTVPLLPNAREVTGVTPFAGPEVTPEAAARVRADDLDLTVFATGDPDDSEEAATAEIGVGSDNGIGSVPIVVGAGTATAALAGWIFLRRRKRKPTEPGEKSVL